MNSFFTNPCRNCAVKSIFCPCCLFIAHSAFLDAGSRRPRRWALLPACGPSSIVPTSLTSIFIEHQLLEPFLGDFRMGRYKTCDPVLRLSILRYVCNTDEHAVCTHRVNDHGGTRHDQRIVCCNGERDTDRMTTPKRAIRRLSHGRNHLCNCKTGLHISAYGIQENQKTINTCPPRHGQEQEIVLIARRFRALAE